MKKLNKKWLIAAAAGVTAVILASAGFLFFRISRKKETLGNENYLASNFLELGFYSKGRTLAQQALENQPNDTSRQLIILSFCYENDFKHADQLGRIYMKKSSDPLLEEICRYAGAGLESGEDKETLIRLHNQVKENLIVADKSKERLEAAEQILSMDGTWSYDYEKIQENLEKLEGAEDVISLRARAYGSALTGDSRQAAVYAQMVVKKEDTLPNRMAAANAVAASYLDSEAAWEDPEIRKIDEELDKLSAEIEELRIRMSQTGAEGGSVKNITKQLEEKEFKARQLYEQKKNIPLQRAMNYMKAKNPGGDQAGYRLQIARLSWLMGDEDTARNIIYEILGDVVREEHGEYLGPEISRMLEAYDGIPSAGGEDAKESGDLNSAAGAVVYGLTQGLTGDRETVYPYDPAGAGHQERPRRFQDFLVQLVSDYREMIHISYVDARKYPQVDIHITTALDDQEAEALVKEDFELYEQGGVITDFELIRGGADSREMSVCFVMDVSGSMSGGAMEDAKSAAENFLMSAKDNFRAGLVKFSGQGEIVSPVTESMGVLTRGIDSLSAAGGTNIADGLRVGIQVLKGCEGAPVIILLSDGADSHTYAIEEIKQQLAEQGIRVYAVGVGNADGDYLKGIADATGGKYIQASDSMELGQVYHRIRQYLYNDFIIRFTVVTDQDNYRRNARLRLREDSYDEEDYIVGVPEDEILTEEQKGILVDFYEQIGGSGKGVRADD